MKHFIEACQMLCSHLLEQFSQNVLLACDKIHHEDTPLRKITLFLKQAFDELH